MTIFVYVEHAGLKLQTSDLCIASCIYCEQVNVNIVNQAATSTSQRQHSVEHSCTFSTICNCKQNVKVAAGLPNGSLL